MGEWHRQNGELITVNHSVLQICINSRWEGVSHRGSLFSTLILNGGRCNILCILFSFSKLKSRLYCHSSAIFFHYLRILPSYMTVEITKKFDLVFTKILIFERSIPSMMRGRLVRGVKVLQHPWNSEGWLKGPRQVSWRGLLNVKTPHEGRLG